MNMSTFPAYSEDKLAAEESEYGASLHAPDSVDDLKQPIWT